MDVLEELGKKVLLLGNEAIVRGALEAGVGFVAAYPGTPSSEVPMTFSRVAKKVGLYFEYSSNEKVAFEAATGAAWSGVRAMTCQKHFGLNVTADSIPPVAMIGVKAGFVVMVADDPSGWSSAQSEQDTRYYARMFKMPMLEPSNPQECKDFTKLAFDISEEFQVPVFLRTTTKISHSIGTVKLGKTKKPKTRGKFQKDPDRYYNLKPRLQELHDRLNKKLEQIEKKYGRKLNTVTSREGKVGILTSGVSFEYVKEALLELGLDPPIAKISLTHPISKSFVSDFVKNKEAVLVLEELEPILENFVKQMAKEANPNLVVHGKDLLPRYGEYTLETVIPAFEEIFGKELGINFKDHNIKVASALNGLPPREPVLCPGCPHRSTFYAVKKVFGDETIYAGDIGCYLLGIFEPLNMQDFVVSMGASIGVSHGIGLVSDQDVVAFVGDSTFFHAGMPPTLNYRFNIAEKTPLIVVLDNAITAMTGHQPHPGSGFTGMGEKVEPVKIEDVVKALGVEAKVANAFSQKQLIKTLQELKSTKGPKALVSRGECRLLTRRRFRAQGRTLPVFEIDKEKCTRCGICANDFGCPAIVKATVEPEGEPEYSMNPDICLGCTVCMQICPEGAIHILKKRRKNEV
ncbi:MAG: indolepyruvate ferredoxin oxidoreductase subunit alpha [Candidatus Bathyarchaeota archaeon]|nr:MAG: indolepyruvate ferredoxin oxidoreductase subunit alpha [Candidatus Bathyarchaeota archaeon]